MIADIHITEKSFGAKNLMKDVKFSIDAREKVGVVGRNGVGKSTLLGMLAGTDKDFSGKITYRRGTVVVATAQEHHDLGAQTTLQYILSGVPDYTRLSTIIESYPELMGDDLTMISEYTSAIEEFEHKGFYQIEAEIERELDIFQLPDAAHRPFKELSGGQKRLVEVVKIMHAKASLALIDEPTNHMDFVAKKQFIDWMRQAPEAMLIITHDRDVLQHVDRIIELRDGSAISFAGNYDAYLKMNAHTTGTAMNEFELTKRRIENLKAKVVQFRRLKERSRDPDTIKQFKRRERQAAEELAELEKIEKPTFWIDKESAKNLHYKTAEQYDSYKAKTISMNVKTHDEKSSRVLVSARDVAVGYDDLLFSGLSFELREGEKMELRGRNGAGKSTLIKLLLGSTEPTLYDGELTVEPQTRIGFYQQEVSQDYFTYTVFEAIEHMYLSRNLPVNETKIRKLMSDYLFHQGDAGAVIRHFSGGQKARLQIIEMLANDPQLLILDEPTNHLDLPSIEELEAALARYTGAILYVSHDDYFRKTIGGNVTNL